MELKVGDLVVGKVVELRSNGALVALAGEESGFIHITELSEAGTCRADQQLCEGQEVLAKVIGYDRLGRPSLSLRRVTSRDREAVEFHQEVVQMRFSLAGRSVVLPERRSPEDRIEWRLARWLNEARSSLTRLQKNRAKRLSERFYTD
ncbi:MAG: S1 RNA-binding domain-containing protein [Candidatus Bipolaricaulaceae bacterium]